MALPPGVTLTQADGGPSYYRGWANTFPADASFFPVGVFPAESAPADLAAAGINFFTPARNDTAGTWCPVASNPNGNDMSHVAAQAGFYAGGAFYGSGPWTRAAFEVFGDELDGNASNWFDCASANIKANNAAGGWGGLTAASFQGAIAASKTDDPTRPVYLQTTVTFMDGNTDTHYTLAQKQAICAGGTNGADIFSFDIYPIVKRSGNVYDTYDQVQEGRLYCQSARPVFPFIEMDHQDGGTIYPTPAQTVAEVWNAIVAGARGIQYFDQNGNITDPAYTGGGHYAAGAMYNAIKAVNAQIQSLAPVLNAPFANNYVTTGASGVRYMAKYSSGLFYIFTSAHQNTSQSVTFTAAGSYSGPVTVVNESRTVTATAGQFTDTFADANATHIYQIPWDPNMPTLVQDANTNHAYNSGNTVITPGVATTAGNTLIIAGAASPFQSASDSLNITDSAGNTWTIGATNVQSQNPPVAYNGGGPYGTFIAWCFNAAAVTTVTISNSGGPFEFYQLDATLSEWTSITRRTDSSAANSATGTIEPPAVVVASANGVVVSATVEQFSSTVTPGAGLTAFTSDTTGQTAYAIPGSAGSFQPQWGASSHPWAAAAAAFDVPAAAGAGILLTSWP